MVKKNKNKKNIEDEDYYTDEEEKLFPNKNDDDEDKELDMELGKIDETVYTKEGRENLEEDSELEPWEEGFMEGASDSGQLSKDAVTGEPLMGVDDVVEIEIEDQTYRFVNKENAEKFKKKKENEDDDEDY